MKVYRSAQDYARLTRVPVVARFVGGTLRVAYDPEANRVAITFETDKGAVVATVDAGELADAVAKMELSWAEPMEIPDTGTIPQAEEPESETIGYVRARARLIEDEDDESPDED